MLSCLPPWCELLSERDVQASVPADLLAQIGASGQLHAGPGRGAALRRLLVSAGRQSWRYRGRLLRVYGPPQEGFYARAFKALALSMWATFHGVDLFFAHSWPSDKYYSPQSGELAWEQHFEPVSSVSMEQIRAGRHCVIELSCKAINWLVFEWGGQHAFSGPGRGIYPTHGPAMAAAHRLLCAAAVSAFVRPRPQLLREAAALWEQMTRRPASSSTTGARPEAALSR